MTERRVKRRKEINAECKVLSVKDLTEFIDKLKHKLKNLAWKNRQQRARQQQRKWTTPSIRTQDQYINTSLIALERRKRRRNRACREVRRNSNCKSSRKRARSVNTDEVESFWRGLWEIEVEDNLDAAWIEEVGKSLVAAVSKEEIAKRVEASNNQ